MDGIWISGPLSLFVLCMFWVVRRGGLARPRAAISAPRSAPGRAVIVPNVPLGALALALLSGAATPVAAEVIQRNPQTRAVLLERVLGFVGGTAALLGMNTMTVRAQGERWVLDEGLRPGMDPRNSAFTLRLAHDLAQERMRLDYGLAGGAAGARQVSEVLVGDRGFIQGQDGAAQPVATRAMLSDRWASIRKHQRLLNPLLLLRELAADDSRVTAAGVDFAGGAYRVLHIDAQPAPLRLYVDTQTGQPVKLLTRESDPLRRDVALEVRYDDWRAAGALRYPARVEVFYDGVRVHTENRSVVAVNAALDAGMFSIPAGLSPVFDQALATRGEVHHQYLQSFAAFGFPRDGVQPQVAATELVPGVFLLRGGSHNSLAVAQANGVVIVEAPLDEVRSHAVLDWVEANIPGKPVTHVVMSHHHADHAGGLRSYVAEGASVVMHDAAVPFFRRNVFGASSRLMPDALAQNPQAARNVQILAVADNRPVALPDPVNPVSVASIPNQHALDLVIVNAGGVVFVVDIYSPFPEAAQLPPAAQHLQNRILELGWQPVAIAGGHGESIPYDEFTELLSYYDYDYEEEL